MNIKWNVLILALFLFTFLIIFVKLKGTNLSFALRLGSICLLVFICLFFFFETIVFLIGFEQHLSKAPEYRILDCLRFV